jgi:LTXXQ motif family protein
MTVIRNAALAVAMSAAMPAFAQTAQDQDTHHPESEAAAPTQPAPPTGTQGFGMPGAGMMGGTGPSGMMGPGGPGMMGAGRMMGPGAGGFGMMGSGGMMGGDMMENMSRMMGMMSMMGTGMRAGTGHIEGRLAFLKAELKITEAQSPEWNAFADAVRGNANAMAETHQRVMSQGAPKTLPERLALEQKAMTAHLDALKKTTDALDKLYGSLDADQKKTADAIIIGPMGMPMGMM